MLDTSRLATLQAVLAHGSFSAAGHALSLTQPAVSRQISLLERQVGTQLVRRTRQGVRPTEAGRVLGEHAEAILGRMRLAEEELAELAGLQRGRIVLGSFFTALVYLSAEAAALLEERHPQLTITDELVDRRAALRGLAAGSLDVAIVFEHDFEPDPAPDGVEIVPLFDDPLRVLLPAGHRLAERESLTLRELARETWVRPHDGPAARLVDHLLRGTEPRTVTAGRGDEPVEAQALIAAGNGIAVAYELGVILDTTKIAVRPLAGRAPVRHIQAAIMRDQRAPAARALVDVLREVGRRRCGAVAIV
jgi:DNA-binding transcriptional LysR family regulator